MGTTLRQELELIEQDRENAVEAFNALCKARYALHKSAKAHDRAVGWLSSGDAYGPAWTTHKLTIESATRYRAAKIAWLEAA